MMTGIALSQQKVSISELKSEGTLNTERLAFRNRLISETIEGNISSELTGENEKKWQGAFWAMELLLYRSENVKQRLSDAFIRFSSASLDFQRSMLESVYCLYPGEFQSEVRQVMKQTRNAKIFAMAAVYLLRNDSSESRAVESLLRQNFQGEEANPILHCLLSDLKGKRKKRPPLKDLLSDSFLKGNTVVFSFQRQDRDFQGLAVIRDSGGRFVRQSDGSIFSIPHLARAVTDLPGYLTNGNTPQGIFSIQGTAVSDNRFIGTTPTIQTVLPYEISFRKYFHSASEDTSWFASYRRMLPESWRGYEPVYQALYAGKAGRSEIIMHGTTIDPEYYKGEPYYPNTPTLGCLSAKELWAEDGSCLLSDQARLVNAFMSSKQQSGFLVVVELDDLSRPVVIDDIIMDLFEAESARKLVD